MNCVLQDYKMGKVYKGKTLQVYISCQEAIKKGLVKQRLIWVQNEYTVLKVGDFETTGL